MSGLQYERMQGTFYLYDVRENGKKTLVSACDQIAMCYSVDTVDGEKMYTLHKHGKEEYVRGWMERLQSRWREAEKYSPTLRGTADSFHMIVFDKDYPLDEINKALAITGYLKFIVEEKNGQGSHRGRAEDGAARAEDPPSR